MPNVVEVLGVGDAVLFETPHAGIYEVRSMSQNAVEVDFLVSHVSPRPGFSGSLFTGDPANTNFSEKELAKVVESIAFVKERLDQSEQLLPEQLALLNRKLDDIQEASNRLGRKDWINYVIGTVTSLGISAAFSDDLRALIVETLNEAFIWFFDSATKLLT